MTHKGSSTSCHQYLRSIRALQWSICAFLIDAMGQNKMPRVEFYLLRRKNEEIGEGMGDDIGLLYIS